MRRGLLLGGFTVLALTAAAGAQSPAAIGMTPTQALGQRLFGQDCGVCHLHPTITSGLYGPALSQALVKGNEAAIRDLISHGSDRMPGFQYYYTPAQINAIVEYLDTVPGGAPAKPAAGNAMSSPE